MVKEKEALETGIQAYIYAYPLVMMGQTLGVSTNVATPEGTSAPMGSSILQRQIGSELASIIRGQAASACSK
jgi:hypothetical protein